MSAERWARAAFILVFAALLPCTSGLLQSAAIGATLTPPTVKPYVAPPAPIIATPPPSRPYSAPPGGPTNITAVMSPVSATLSWSAVPGATGYLVERLGLQTAGQFSLMTPVPIPQTSFVDTYVAAGTSMTWRIRVVSADGHQSASAPVTFVAPPYTNPASLSATVEIGGIVTLRWAPVAGAYEYQIDRYLGQPPSMLAGQPPAAGATTYDVPPNTTQLVDYTANLSGSYGYQVIAYFSDLGPGPIFFGLAFDRSHTPPQAQAVLRGPQQHMPWLTRSDPIPSQPPDTTGSIHNAEANQYLNAIGTFPNKATLAQWMQVNDMDPKGSLLSPPIRAVYFNAGDLNLGRDMRCKQTGQHIACMVSNFAPPANFFAADAPDLQTALAGATQGVHASANGYLATVAMEMDTTNPYNSVKFYVYAGANDAASTVAVLDTEANGSTHLPAGYSPFNCIACHGGSYDTSTHSVTGASFLPFDVYSFKYSQQPGFTQSDQEEGLRRLNALVRATRPPSPVGADPIVTFIDGMYAGQVGIPGARANDNWVPIGWTTPSPAGPNVYNAIVKPFCRTCHLAIPGDLSFPSYAKFRSPAVNPISNQILGGQRDVLQAALCGGEMPQGEVPFRKFWQNPTVSWINYLQDPSVAGIKCN